MDIPYRPLNHETQKFLVVKKEASPTKTRTGISLPKKPSEDKELNYGTVLRVSEGINDPKVGDRIQWKEYTGALVYGEKDIYVVDLEEVLIVFEEIK